MAETAQRSNRLRELREVEGLGRSELAVEFGVESETIIRWEKGDIPTKWLRPLAARFGVSISHLLCDDQA